MGIATAAPDVEGQLEANDETAAMLEFRCSNAQSVLSVDRVERRVLRWVVRVAVVSVTDREVSLERCDRDEGRTSLSSKVSEVKRSIR